MRWTAAELDPRRAGDVVRYHIERTIQTQTVASHSWNAARILLAIWPDAPRTLLVEVLMHDVGEGVVGDVPSPSKRAHPDLREVLDKAEDGARLSMALPWAVTPRQRLSDIDEAALSAVDLLEAWEHCLVEVNYGNRHAEIMVTRCEVSLPERLAALPEPTRGRAVAYMSTRRRVLGLDGKG
jgi:5'-deoxynucleotidase YfbR-like HD superfamily hydrolase